MASKQEEAQANEKLLEPSPQMPMPYPTPNPYVSNSPPAYSPAVSSNPDPAISTAAHSSHVVVTQPAPIIYYPEVNSKAFASASSSVVNLEHIYFRAPRKYRTICVAQFLQLCFAVSVLELPPS